MICQKEKAERDFRIIAGYNFGPDSQVHSAIFRTNLAFQMQGDMQGELSLLFRGAEWIQRSPVLICETAPHSSGSKAQVWCVRKRKISVGGYSED